MELKGSKWRMTRRRRRSRPWLIAVLVVLIGAFVYVNQVVVPATPPLFVNTPTPTRAPESFLTEAQALFAAGNLRQAILAYQQAILADSTNPSIYVELARVQVLAGEHEAALTSAQNALLLNPNNPQAQGLQGWAQYLMGDTLTAEASIKEALALDPNNALAHAFYAELLADQALFEQAGEESRLALSLAPDMLEAHRARGYVLELTGNYAEAIQEYQAAVQINDKIPELFIALGRNYSILEENDQAVEAFIKANALNPQNPLPDTFIARTYAKIGQFSKAVQYAQQAVQDDGSDPFLRGSLGVMLYRNGEREQALDQLALAIQGGTAEDGTVVQGIPLSPDFRVTEYYFTYGLGLARLNRCREAVPIFQALLSGVPDDEIAVYNANEGLNICSENLSQPPTAEEGEATPTPEA